MGNYIQLGPLNFVTYPKDQIKPPGVLSKHYLPGQMVGGEEQPWPPSIKSRRLAKRLEYALYSFDENLWDLASVRFRLDVVVRRYVRRLLAYKPEYWAYTLSDMFAKHFGVPLYVFVISSPDNFFFSKPGFHMKIGFVSLTITDEDIKEIWKGK